MADHFEMTHGERYCITSPDGSTRHFRRGGVYAPRNETERAIFAHAYGEFIRPETRDHAHPLRDPHLYFSPTTKPLRAPVIDDDTVLSFVPSIAQRRIAERLGKLPSQLWPGAIDDDDAELVEEEEVGERRGRGRPRARTGTVTEEPDPRQPSRRPRSPSPPRAAKVAGEAGETTSAPRSRRSPRRTRRRRRAVKSAATRGVSTEVTAHV